MPKGYISEFMGGGRIVAHGQITDLSRGFSLPDGALFTVYARPKDDVEGLDALLSVRCYQDEDFSPAPVVFNDWSPLAISGIAPDQQAVLQDIDLYWGSGESVGQEEEG